MTFSACSHIYMFVGHLYLFGNMSSQVFGQFFNYVIGGNGGCCYVIGQTTFLTLVT